jgi:hypothetical protein
MILFSAFPQPLSITGGSGLAFIQKMNGRAYRRIWLFKDGITLLKYSNVGLLPRFNEILTV